VASAELPAEFVAIKVYCVDELTANGVPEITQVDVFTESPVGKTGVDAFIAQFVMAAPRASRVVGLTDIATPKDPLVPVALAYESTGMLAAT